MCAEETCDYLEPHEHGFACGKDCAECAEMCERACEVCSEQR